MLRWRDEGKIFDNHLGYKGKVHIDVIKNNIITDTTDIDNMITDAWITLVTSAFMKPPVDLEIKYIAIGDGTTAPAASDTQLENERFRKALTKQQRLATGQIDSTTYIAPYEANFTIQEVGFFGGSSATKEVNSGTMVARVLYYKPKNDLESLQIVRSDILGRV